MPKGTEKPHAFYHPTRLIITGPKEILGTDGIGGELRELGVQPLDPTRVLPLQLPDLRTARIECIALDEVLGDRVTEGDWVIALFETKPGRVLEEAIADIVNALGHLLFAHPDATIGDPQHISGSPQHISGSPAPVPDDPPAGEQFRDQWAFGAQSGIDLHGSAPVTKTPTVLPGVGVRVGVFDTSPYPPGTETIGWLPAPYPTLELEVEDVPAYLPVPTETRGGGAVEHGLFVSGLVHAVAPGADTHLYRVLNDDCEGYLFTLVAMLLFFINDVRDSPSRRGVINLSLGVESPHDAEKRGIPHPYYKPEEWQELLDRLPDILGALKVALAIAYCSGIAVVAAAGNDSSFVLPPRDCQIPASYDFVVGAEASCIQRVRGCFSNAGDVSAPGCGLISTVTLDASDTRFAYWSGTSFSAPLVAGLCARLLSATPAHVHGFAASGAVSDTVRAKTKPAGEGVSPGKDIADVQLAEAAYP